jgi:hypothetical protein
LRTKEQKVPMKGAYERKFEALSGTERECIMKYLVVMLTRIYSMSVDLSTINEGTNSFKANMI